MRVGVVGRRREEERRKAQIRSQRTRRDFRRLLCPSLSTLVPWGTHAKYQLSRPLRKRARLNGMMRRKRHACGVVVYHRRGRGR